MCIKRMKRRSIFGQTKKIKVSEVLPILSLDITNHGDNLQCEYKFLLMDDSHIRIHVIQFSCAEGHRYCLLTMMNELFL